MQRKLLALTCALIVLLAFTACSKKTEPQAATPEPQNTAQQAADEQTEDPQLNDVNITGKNIINTYGNYIIPIPDSMWDKIEFTKSGAKTVITHKTHDSTQQEQNPVLVEVGAVQGGEEYSGESFIEIGDYVFFRNIRYDMPYTADSEDAKEFSELYEMLPQVLNTLELIDMTSTLDDNDGIACAPDEDPVVSEAGTPFTVEDAYITGIKIGDRREDIVALIGPPESTDEITFEATGEVRHINNYSFGQLVYVSDVLVVAQVTDMSIDGPRGIRVGMNLDEITAMFASAAEYNDESMTIFYRANEGDDNTNMCVPPSGVLYKGDMQTLAFAEFAPDSGFDMSDDELAEGGYMFVEQYDLICQFDSQGTMLSFAVRIGTPSE